MEWYDIQVDGRHTVKFSDLPYMPLASPPHSPDAEDLFIGQKLGGIIRHGEWAWLARNSVLQVVSLRNDHTISTYEFCESRGYESCCIKCVEEIFPNNPEVMLLAVILENFRGPGGGCSYVALYSVELGSVLNCIELSLHITCARFMDSSACRRSLLQNFDGCLAIGSEEGVIVLLDLNIRKITSLQYEPEMEHFVPCHIVDFSLPLTEIHRNFRQCQEDGIHFALQMEVIESPCSIQCILPIDLILGLAIGLEDGRLALYDLAELQIFYVALPTPEITMSALVKMDFLEPPDDPRPCLYIWTLHENGENLHSVLHCLMYEKRLMEEDESGTYFESFRTSSVRLQLPLEATKSTALACQTISSISSNGEDDSNCLCAISWLSVLECKNKLLIFDLNQWYKEEMPFVLEYGKQPSYLAGYILNGECTGLHTLLNANNIAHFNSIQRFEEHFYPNSLSFEVSLLHYDGCRRYNWEGAQNRVINLLRSSNAAIFLEPNFYFDKIIRTRLMPQFIELNINSTFSRNAKYEILLSAALEHNCVSLLRDCAKSWIDGSFMGNFTASTGLSLSTLTDWIWMRATTIKTRCNDLCKSLFEFGGYPLDNREQKELGFITRQLKLLSDLLREILDYAKKQIPERVYNDLEKKLGSLLMASSYQDVLLWLLNIGLLPEASPYTDKINSSNDLVPYPYKELKQFYQSKRLFFHNINETFISKRTGNCRMLFIDSFIERVCKGNVLYEYWLENEGDGLYPPNSLEAMLRVMLVPDLEYDDKCAILLYFFLDLNMAIDEDVHRDVVSNFIKFPSVFKLSASLIKTVQAFWNLDHDHYLASVDEFISPFNKNQCHPQWQVELVIEVLLCQKASNLALRILESQPTLISPLLKLKIFLANELISEAFHFARSKSDDSLLETFFSCCLRNGLFGVIRDLALSDKEGYILQNILKKCNTSGAESLHFVYLLQKSKYIEAVSYMDELSHRPKNIKSLHQSSQMETPHLVLSAFNTTMTPVTQGLADVYFRIKNKIKKKEIDNKSPVPLSCQLIKQNANNLLGGIYHSSALSAHFATYYWGEMEDQTKQAKHMLSSNNAPFLRRPQIDTNCIEIFPKTNISYPQAYKVIEKRTFAESEMLDNQNDGFESQKIANKLNPKKKRRLIGQEIVDDLSHFMKTKKNTNTFNVSEFTFGPEKNSQTIEETSKKSFELPTLPLLTKPTVYNQESVEIAKNVPEIHGILKMNTPEPGQLCERDPPVEEEKNLRFLLPSPDDSSSHTNIEEAKTDEPIKEKEVTNEGDQMYLSSLSNSPKFRGITRAVSEESSKSSISSGNQSEDNFYSPLSSQNNSKLDCSNLSKYSFMSGPQPRKPLARLSAERLEKSLTPEREPKITVLTTPKSSSDYGLNSKISPRGSIERAFGEYSNKCNSTTVSKGFSNTTYVTAFETLTEPLKLADSNSKTEIAKTTSVLGSVASHSTFAGSKINEFLPKVSSSKVGESPVKTNKPPSPVKLSERSTVLDSLTTFECTNSGSNNVFPMTSTLLENLKSTLGKRTEDQKQQMLETTLDMSTYDFSMSETTGLKQVKSSSMINVKDVPFRLETGKTVVIKNAELPVEDENNKMECDKPMKEVHIDDNREQDPTERRTEIAKESRNQESNDGCILLFSSSSSSASLADEVDDYVNNEDDFEMCYDIDESIENEEYGGEENSEELSVNETDNSSDIENEDVIQLIEDSSSDACQQPTNCYEDSDSDDVKVVENDQKLVDANVEDKERKDFPSISGKEDNIEKDKAMPKQEDCVEFVTSTISVSPSIPARRSEFKDSKSDKSSDESFVAPNDTSEVLIQTNKTVSTPVDKIIAVEALKTKVSKSDENTNMYDAKETTEDKIKLKVGVAKIENVLSENKEEHLLCPKTIEALDDTTEVKEELKSVEQEKPGKLNELKDDEILVLKYGSLKGIEKIPFENREDQLSGAKDVIQDLERSQKTEEEQMTLTLYYSIDSTDDNRQNESEKESSTEEIKSKEENKSEDIRKVEKSNKNMKNIKEVSKMKEHEASGISVSTPSQSRALRGSSVPPIILDKYVVAAVSSPLKKVRGISAPPQTNTETEELATLTPRTRRSVRARSLQPRYILDEGESSTPHKDKERQNTESPEINSRSTRGSSVPAGTTSSRRRSVLLEAINEDSTILDSPSTRTRLKSRLNSMDSELDSSIVSVTDQSTRPKRIRRPSVSNNLSELTPTPKRTRHNSISSQSEASGAITPRALRARSVLSAQGEDSESISASPKPTSNKRIGTKRKNTIPEEPISESQEPTEVQISPKSDNSSVSEVSYSSSRRLTRTQLAVMEKSAALSKKSTQDEVTKETNTVSPPPKKRTQIPRSTRASNADSDDAESISSKLSTASSAAGSKRRVTRRFLKEKDEFGDDDSSVTSSVGSVTQRRSRQKDIGSPNSILTAIPEDEPVETKKRGRPTRH